jgi:hypothetical protein
MKLERIKGPPGTGKTTTISQDAAQEIERVGRNKVLVASLTRAAAHEAARVVDLPEKQIGTWHSFAFHALGRPELAEVHVADPGGWNDTYPTMSVSGKHAKGAAGDTPAFEPGGWSRGDRLLLDYGCMRAMQVSRPWREDIEHFASRWEYFKSNCGYMDFHDLIERARDIERAPGDPATIYCDEYQDVSMAEARLIVRWSRKAGRLVLCGDSFQSLYQFRGSNPAEVDALWESLLHVERTERTLEQSYRIPRAVHTVAMMQMRRCAPLKPVEYRPRDADGVVTRAASFKEGASLVRHAGDYLKDGKSIMFIATCSYMLEPILKELAERGLPWHNPWRSSNGRWNPLQVTRGISFRERCCAFTRPSRAVWGDEASFWTLADVKAWAQPLPAKGIFQHGQKTKLANLKTSLSDLDVAQGLQSWFTPEALGQILQFNLDWYLHAIPDTEKKTSFRLVKKIAEQQGPQKLLEEPQITVGTVHCSPGDEPILTNEGWVSIEKLETGRHRLASYEARINRLYWGRGHASGVRGYGGHAREYRGYPFVRASRWYEGEMLTLETPYSRTRVTPNHRVPVRFSEQFFDKWIVYLMRRGNWWRVGFCTSGHRPYYSGGLAGRLATEKADAGWILGVYATRREARLAEVYIQARFGVHGLTFQTEKDRILIQRELQMVHEETSDYMHTRAVALLESFGMREDMPLYVRSGGSYPHRRIARTGHNFNTFAANIISDYMEVPTILPEFVEGRSTGYSSPRWAPVTVSREHFSGLVYSLDVPPYHHYISGGAVVHNSLKGSEADVVYLCPDLSQAAVQASAISSLLREEIQRVFYVGVTRAREVLVLCQPGSNLYVGF